MSENIDKDILDAMSDAQEQVLLLQAEIKRLRGHLFAIVTWCRKDSTGGDKMTCHLRADFYDISYKMTYWRELCAG